MTPDAEIPLEERPLILVAKMDDAAKSFYTDLRRKYFPPARNYLEAHVTLFHALPGSAVKNIEEVLLAASKGSSFMRAKVSKLNFTGNGVSIALDCIPLSVLREALAKQWASWLTPQDRQKFLPHITIQNKVPSLQARELYDALNSSTDLHLPDIMITGFELHRYDGGPWHRLSTYSFEKLPCR